MNLGIQNAPYVITGGGHIGICVSDWPASVSSLSVLDNCPEENSEVTLPPRKTNFGTSDFAEYEPNW